MDNSNFIEPRIERNRLIRRYFKLLILGLVPIGLSIMLYSYGSYPRVTVESNTFNLDNFESIPDQVIEIWPEFRNVDIGKRVVDYSIYIEPLTYGTQIGNSFAVKKNFTIWGDSTNGENQHVHLAGYAYGGFDGQSTLAPAKDINTYPFDEYFTQFGFYGYDFSGQQDSAEYEIGETKPLNIDLQYRLGNVIENFQTHIARISYSTEIKNSDPALQATLQREINDGYAMLEVVFTRDHVTRILAGFITLFISVIPVVAYFLYRSIRTKRRPPNVTALVWVNALTFTTVLARGILPGNPPIGIYLDIFILFPSIIATSIFSMLMTKQWLQRDDHSYS